MCTIKRSLQFALLTVGTTVSILGFASAVTFPPTGGILFQSDDKNTNAKLFGYMQAYYADFNGDARNQSPAFNNGAVIPSARAGLMGNITPDWNYKFLYDFGTSSIAYAYAQYTGFHHFMLTGGQFKPASSMDILVDRPSMTFLEYSLPTNAFSVGFALGAQALFYNDYFTVAGGVFAPNTTGSINGVTVTGSDSFGVNWRATYSPIHQDAKMFHLGLGGYNRQADQGTDIARFRSIPELRGRSATAFFVDTSNISGVDDYTVNNAEIAGIYDSFSAQAEYYLTNVDRMAANNLNFSGYYAALSYFLTGESRVYSFKDGAFSGISPILHHYGAWELALRCSHVNLTSQNIAGGKESDITTALNWYPIQRVKVGLNYIYADGNPSGNGLNRKMHIIGLLLQTML